MADQWGRKIYNAILDIFGVLNPNTEALKEASYDRRDENGIEVPGIPGETPPPETSFHQKTHDNILHIKSTLDLFAPGAYATIGHVPGVIPKTVSSWNPEITSLTIPEDIWQKGGLYTGQPDLYTPATIDIDSTSSDDDGPNGIGAHAISIEGLDENKDFQSEIFRLNGTATVTSTSLWYRVTSAAVVEDPTPVIPPNVNVGTIQIVSGANIFIQINPGDGFGNVAGFTVPAGKSIIISDYGITSGNDDSIGFFRIKLLVRSPGGAYQNLDFIELNVSIGQVQKSVVGILLREFTDVLLHVHVSNVSTAYSGHITYLEIDNSLIDLVNANYVV